jgi:hypothetical protein
MNNKSSNALIIILPVLLVITLMLIALIAYPEILSYSMWNPVITFAGLIIYVLTWFYLKPGRFSINGGLFIGFLFTVNISLEDFINWPSKTLVLVSTLTMMFLIFVSFLIISAIKTIRTDNIYKGVQSSFISSLLGTAIALCSGFLICYLFPGRMADILKWDRGFNDFNNPGAFAFFNAFDNASSHIIMVPVVSIIIGSLGAAIALLILKFRKTKPMLN